MLTLSYSGILGVAIGERGSLTSGADGDSGPLLLNYAFSRCLFTRTASLLKVNVSYCFCLLSATLRSFQETGGLPPDSGSIG